MKNERKFDQFEQMPDHTSVARRRRRSITLLQRFIDSTRAESEKRIRRWTIMPELQAKLQLT